MTLIVTNQTLLVPYSSLVKTDTYSLLTKINTNSSYLNTRLMFSCNGEIASETEHKDPRSVANKHFVVLSQLKVKYNTNTP